MLATLASRGMGALSDAEGCWHLEQAVMRGAPWRLAMRVFTDKMPPLQQALFNISATEKPQRRSFLLLMTTPLTAA